MLLIISSSWIHASFHIISFLLLCCLCFDLEYWSSVQQGVASDFIFLKMKQNYMIGKINIIVFKFNCERESTVKWPKTRCDLKVYLWTMCLSRFHGPNLCHSHRIGHSPELQLVSCPEFCYTWGRILDLKWKRSCLYLVDVMITYHVRNYD